MATKRSKNGDEERLDPSNIEKVISLLEPKDESKQPITKKAACEILNIAYNTTRLAKLIDAYKDKKERTAKRRAELRGKPVTEEDAVYMISEYLSGQPVQAISESTHRSTAVVNNVLEQYAVPMRAKAYDYFNPEVVPDGAVRGSFKVGELVYAMAYDSAAVVDKEIKHPEGNVYRVWLKSDKWQQFAYQPAWELASLEHLIKLGVKV